MEMKCEDRKIQGEIAERTSPDRDGRKLVLHVITRLDFGGSSQQVLFLADRIREFGFDSIIIAGRTEDPHTSLDDFKKRTGIEVIMVDEMRRTLDPLRDCITLFKLYRLFKALKPDVIHTNCSKAGVLGRLAARANGRTPVVHTTHGHLFYGYYNSFITKLIVLTERLMAPLADKVVLLTKRSIDEHVERGIARREKFVAISPGIDISKYGQDSQRKKAFREAHNIGENVTVIGWAGRLTRIKSPENLLEAAAIVKDMVPNTFFAILGEGDLLEELKSRSNQLGLTDRVLFLGKSMPVREFMAAIDVFVLSSSNEGLGIVLLEAMASGVPVVATEVGGVGEVLDGGKAGLLARPDDPLSLARCMLFLLKNRQSNAELADRGRERVMLYSERGTVEKYVSLYRELFEAGRTGKSLS